MKFDSKDFGVKLLETITAGLYDGNPNCLREYIQNSIDAKAKFIKIYYENGKNDLIIEDDGYGMDKSDLKFALGIGKSNKTEAEGGWRGIGIWSGSSNCSNIVIITKKKNSSRLRIEINNDEIRKGIETGKPILETLESATSDIEELELGKGESLEDTHFTIVRLESILPHQRWVFIEDDIREYLQKTVPLRFDKEHFSFSKEINFWLESKGVVFPSVHIEFEKRELFRPPFKSDIFHDKLVFKEFKEKEKLIAVCWVLTSNKNRVLSKPNRGIFFKKKGFTLGDENLVRNQYEGTYAPWQYGEIHIVSKEIRENAARNNFEYNTDVVASLIKQVGKFVRSLYLLNQYQSDRIVSNKIEKAKKLIAKSDYKPAEAELKKAESSLDRGRSFPPDQSLDVMKPVIDSQSKRNEKDLERLKKEIIKVKSSQLTGKDYLDTLMKTMPKDFRKLIATRKGGKLQPVSNITDPIKEKLEKKAGINETEFRILTQKAYGWKSVNGDSPLLVIEPDPKYKNRNYQFGVLIYAVHDLFVNFYKHKQGKDSFGWFDNLSKDDQSAVLLEMLTTIRWICRVIDNSKKCQP